MIPEPEFLKNINQKYLIGFFQIDDASHGNQSGSGIGFALVKELATLHNWNISVNSKEGEGTVFTLTIPLEKATEVSDEKIQPSFKESEDEKFEDVSLLIDEENKVESERNRTCR